METTQTDVVVIGAGQAGLGTAKLLGAAGLSVIVIDRGRIGETWLSQRWESFSLNTPNWMNGLPGMPFHEADPDGFVGHGELVAYFARYVTAFEIDVRTGVDVTRVSERRLQGPGRFLVEGSSGQGRVSFLTTHVVVASGIANSPRIPPVSSKLPETIRQLSTGTYKSAQELPDGAVLVVGGGQSGGQIVEDLLEAGRTVYFSISNVGRVPRRYRGQDFMYWMLELGMWDMATDDADASMVGATNPLTSGVGPRGRTVSFQKLAADGVHLMGRLVDIDDGVVRTDDRITEYVQFSDNFSRDLKDSIDAYIAETGIDAPPAEVDPADVAILEGASLDFITDLVLEEAGVGTVIWCTGFTADFSWIEAPVTDQRGMPVHNRGVSMVEGLYFMGFPWLAKKKSGVVYGVEEDARHIVETVTASRS